MSDAPSSDDLGSMATVMAALASTKNVATLAPGALVADQYRIERKLGAGGMGVVFLATDERLGRSVAIKIGHAVSSDGLRRIEREARALAQLSHPNVVVVHQVGELGGRVFIVMEHVAGGTARTWLDETKRDWRAIVDLYLAAGDGLAAAHAAGLVHRDFKPDNVLVGSDGRPRVADFGLVQSAGLATATAMTPSTGGATRDDAAGAESADMTETGAVIGTPAYMPPEQLGAGEIDARADQFAFAASLWEALYGGRPFDGATPAEVQTAIASEPPRRGDAGTGSAPRAIEQALRRALAADRADRWPDLPALLAALRRARDQRRRRMLAAGGGAVVLAAGAALALGLSRGAAAEPCTGGEREIATVWNPARAAQLATHVDAADWPAIRTQLDDYARRWALGHREACRAVRVTRTQSEAMLDRRGVCLARVASVLETTLAAIERGTPDGDVHDLIARLPDIGACDAVAALGAEDPPPADLATRPALLATLRAVSEATAITMSDVDPQGTAIAERALAQARAVGWRPEIARALDAVAAGKWNDGDHEAAIVVLREAVDLALAGHSDATAATALADLARNLSSVSKFDEARLALQMAGAVVSRLEENEPAREAVSLARVQVELDSERYDDAIAAGREHVRLAADQSAERRGAAHFKLGQTFALARRWPQVIEHADAALALFTEAHGAEHPRVASALALRAMAKGTSGEIAAALPDATRSLAILEGRFGTDGRRLHEPLLLLGELARQRGEPAEAERHWSRAVAIAERHALSPGELAPTLVNLAILDLEAGKIEAGLARLERALPLFEAYMGANSPALTDTLVARAYALRALGRFAASRTDLERAVQLSAKGYGPLHPTTTNAQIELANTLVAAGDRASAIAMLTAQMAAVDGDTSGRPPHQPIELRLALASAHWAAGDRAAARRVADEAARRAGDTEPAHSMVAAWRAEHR